MSWIDKLREAQRLARTRPLDPWRGRLAAALKGVEAMSSAALLDLLGANPTSANARRLAVVMRELGFVPIKTRRFMPGGYRDTVTRGWVRPVRGPSPLPTPQGAPSTKVER